MSVYTVQDLNAAAGSGFVCGILFWIALQFITNLILDGIVAWRRKKRKEI